MVHDDRLPVGRHFGIAHSLTHSYKADVMSMLRRIGNRYGKIMVAQERERKQRVVDGC